MVNSKEREKKTRTNRELLKNRMWDESSLDNNHFSIDINHFAGLFVSPCLSDFFFFFVFVCIEMCHKLSNWIEWNGWIHISIWMNIVKLEFMHYVVSVALPINLYKFPLVSYVWLFIIIHLLLVAFRFASTHMVIAEWMCVRTLVHVWLCRCVPLLFDVLVCLA